MNDPKIKLGDAEYVIPKLVIKQNRYVEPLIAKNFQFFADAKNNLKNKNLLNLTDEQVSDFMKIVYHAITRGTPGLTWEQFEELPISIKDIMVALPTCVQQSGLFSDKPAAGGAQAPGEAPSPSTGTGS